MSALRDELRRRLRAAADPARALPMQAYMKSAMPYLGIQATPPRAICKARFFGLTWKDSAAWRRAVLEICCCAQFREEHYAAIELTRHKSARTLQRLDTLPMYREMIVTGAWTDLVDALVGGDGAILHNDLAEMTAVLRQWAKDDDMWLRRAAIFCQLGAKDETDLAPLYDCTQPSLESKEFFLRKAIGWALRQYARTDAEEVVRYFAANAQRLSPLSRREALKHIG